MLIDSATRTSCSTQATYDSIGTTSAKHCFKMRKHAHANTRTRSRTEATTPKANRALQNARIGGPNLGDQFWPRRLMYSHQGDHFLGPENGPVFGTPKWFQKRTPFVAKNAFGTQPDRFAIASQPRDRACLQTFVLEVAEKPNTSSQHFKRHTIAQPSINPKISLPEPAPQQRQINKCWSTSYVPVRLAQYYGRNVRGVCGKTGWFALTSPTENTRTQGYVRHFARCWAE